MKSKTIGLLYVPILVTSAIFSASISRANLAHLATAGMLTNARPPIMDARQGGFSPNAAIYQGLPGPGRISPAIMPAKSYSLIKDNDQGILFSNRTDSLQQAQSSSDALIVTSSFNGIDGPSGPYAADPTMAAGPTSLILGSNEHIAILDKTGSALDSIYIFEFFSYDRHDKEPAADPRILFDPWSERFFIVAIGRLLNPDCLPGSCVAHIWLAVSKNSEPQTLTSADWYFYVFDGTVEGTTPTTYWSDFPGLGVNRDVVVISSVAVDQTPASHYSRIRILDKSKLIDGLAASWTDFVRMVDPVNGLSVVNFQPALHMADSETFYLVSPSTAVSCGLTIWAINDAESVPILSARTADLEGQCDNPPSAPQPNSDALPLATGNKWQLSAAVYDHDSLWTARSISADYGSGLVSAIRWYEVDVRTWPNSVSIAQSAVLGMDRIWYFYPAVMVDSSKNFGMVFNCSSSEQYPSICYTGRLEVDQPNTLRPPALLKSGLASFSPADSSGAVRFGDYSGIAMDPEDESLWIFAEYARTPEAWGTWVGNIIFNPDAAYIGLYLPAISK